MISVSDFVHLTYTNDLTQGGIAYALHALPNTYRGGSPYDRLRKIVADAAVELAFRRYLSEQAISFEVKGAIPFTEPDHFDVALAGRRCSIQTYLISHREQILEMKRTPQVVLQASALVASDQNAAEGNLNSDIYLFAFLSGLTATSSEGMQKEIQRNKPSHWVHVMPDAWIRPQKWTPLGALVLKSESEQNQTIEIGGQDAGREMRSLEVELPSRTRIQLDERFFSVAYIHAPSAPTGRIGIHSPVRNETHILRTSEWGNIWVYGTDILLAGYLMREEFMRRAHFVREGVRVFQYEKTRTKNLAVSVSDLRPLSELLAHVKEWNS